MTLSNEDIELIISALERLKTSSFILSNISESQSLAIDQRIQQIKEKLVKDE